MKLKKTEMEFVSLQRVCRVATVDKKGMPHSVPVCPVVAGDRIYFATEKGSTKVRNMMESGKAALVCDEYSEIWSYLRGICIQGDTRVIPKGPAFHKVRKMLYQKFTQYEGAFPIKEGTTVVVEIIPKNTESWGL
jgi:nitroimidazol reductase NimA-like FMN-containing flavoprotein (pyridoxamine 5'-phosphate oxidase superfamily)